ncbi:MAG: SH3 domain-containing protein [Hyphomonadaceae bacterium]|jgi:SH3-like domain-containing protein|nr:SH3 domain-containing protein [Hyphomonadaceae bacterium]
MFARGAHILCVLMLLAAGSGLVHGQGADGPDFWAVTGVRSNDALNMRMAPNADSEAIARIPYNARGLKNHGCPNDVTFEQWKRMTKAQRDQAARSRWCQVEYEGRKGWVAGRFLREDGGPSR